MKTNTTLWAARDKNGSFWLYTEKPVKCEKLGIFVADCDYDKYDDDYEQIYLKISSSLLPDVTWENSPKKVKLTIEE